MGNKFNANTFLCVINIKLTIRFLKKSKTHGICSLHFTSTEEQEGYNLNANTMQSFLFLLVIICNNVWVVKRRAPIPRLFGSKTTNYDNIGETFVIT